MSFIYNIPIFNNAAVFGIPFRAGTQNYTGALPVSGSDTFSSNPIYDTFSDKAALTRIAKNNPRIMDILKENDIALNINTRELEKLRNKHLKDTRIAATKIYSWLPPELKQEVNLSDLQQAAALHDIGKIFIPEEILNKSGALTDEERKIMELHSELGAELISSLASNPSGSAKFSGYNGAGTSFAPELSINDAVLNLIKYHHQNPKQSGYPEINDGYEYGIAPEILSAADKYCALREKRCYKDAMSHDEALKVMAEDVEKGLISPEVYLSLSKNL